MTAIMIPVTAKFGLPSSKVSPVEGPVKGNEPEGVKSFQRPKG
jgi:hypothetical protein